MSSDTQSDSNVGDNTKTFIPLCVPTIGGNEWEYVKECLDTSWVSYVGSYVDRFENMLTDVTGARFCVATNTGTSALHIALVLFGVEPDTEVVMPAISFVAPANAIRYCHAWPVLIDVDPATWQIDLSKLEDFLQNACERNAAGELINRHTRRRVVALLPVHLLGAMADVEAVAELARRFELPLIEDAAECLGATYHDRGIAAPIRETDPARRIVVTSFNGNKIVTTGGGGALMCDDEQLAGKAKHLTTTAKTDAIEFHHDVVGYNYRLSNVLAAIGVGQLELLDKYVQAKRAIAARYHEAFAEIPDIETAPTTRAAEGTNWMYTILVRGRSHDLIRQLNAQGIQSRPIWVPIHQLPEFRDRCYCHAAEFADRFYESALSLPCSVSLGIEDQQRVIESLADWFG